MSAFALAVTESVDRYVDLQHSLGYQFQNQAASLHAFLQYINLTNDDGPLSQQLALAFVTSKQFTPNGKARHYAVIRRFAQYHVAFDPRTELLDRRALPRSRAVKPPRILTEQELQSLMLAGQRISINQPLRGQTLVTIVGLLASTGLRSGEALRLDHSDVDLTTGVLRILKTKFRKDRLVPVHTSTLAALQEYERHRSDAFPLPSTQSFFVSTRGNRLSSSGLYYGFQHACTLAKINEHKNSALRPHDLRHRFAVTRLAEWHRQKVDVQSMLPLLATYLGHVRYSDTAYYITATPELLALAATKVFEQGDAT